MKRQPIKLKNVAFYYLSDNDGKPRVTVCLGQGSDRVISRGYAICSLKDQPAKSEGRRLALYNVLRAFKKCSNTHLVVRSEAIEALGKIHPNKITVTWRSQYNVPNLNDFESKLVENWK